jgi:glc operon protein GlcG
MPLVACALLLLSQAEAPPPATFFTADQLLQAIQSAPDASPGHPELRAARLLATPDYSVMEVRRTGPEKAEVHVSMADVWYVLRGSATVVTGGSLIDSAPSGPGELRGSGVSGGQSRKVNAGDVVVVPAGVPHWTSAVEGPEVVYLIVKVQTKP